MIITSSANAIGASLSERSANEIKNEPMLFNCDMAGAERLGGPLTLEFLELLPNGWGTIPIVIDSRVHMLMPGWYPCIPGWHHDDVPRTRSDGQPNYGPGQCRSEHIMALVGGEICPTLFALGEAAFEEPELGRTIYADWHGKVERWINMGVLSTWSIPSNRLIHFNDRAWHRGTKALANGWRFFIRASRYFDPEGRPIPRGNPRTNEVRRQVQVYLEDPNAGW